jgi:hypothetical protein
LGSTAGGTLVEQQLNGDFARLYTYGLSMSMNKNEFLFPGKSTSNELRRSAIIRTIFNPTC